MRSAMQYVRGRGWNRHFQSNERRRCSQLVGPPSCIDHTGRRRVHEGWNYWSKSGARSSRVVDGKSHVVNLRIISLRSRLLADASGVARTRFSGVGPPFRRYKVRVTMAMVRVGVRVSVRVRFSNAILNGGPESVLERWANERLAYIRAMVIEVVETMRMGRRYFSEPIRGELGRRVVM